MIAIVPADHSTQHSAGGAKDSLNPRKADKESPTSGRPSQRRTDRRRPLSTDDFTWSRTDLLRLVMADLDAGEVIQKFGFQLLLASVCGITQFRKQPGEDRLGE